MSTQITVKVEGLEQAVAKLTPQRANGPIGRFLDRGAIYIQSRARENAPVDTGRLRGSIGIDAPSDRMREIGANTDYAEYVEKGTSAHFPPPSALQGWALRHGFSGPQAGFLVARAISRSGTKPRPYMKPAAEAGEAFVKSLVPTLAAELEAAYSGGGD